MITGSWTDGQHVSRVFVTFASGSPRRAMVVLVKGARSSAVGQHPSWILGAFPGQRPSVTLHVVIDASEPVSGP